MANRGPHKGVYIIGTNPREFYCEYGCGFPYPFQPGCPNNNILPQPQQQPVQITKPLIRPPWMINGITKDDPLYIPRTDKVDHVMDILSNRRMVWFKGSASSGKTAFAQLIADRYELGEVVIVPFTSTKNATQSLIDYAGIDVNDVNLKSKYKLIIIDDAQNQYSDSGFWQKLIKSYIAQTTKENCHFVINSTHSFNMDSSVASNPSPVDQLADDQYFGFDFLKLTDNEEFQMLEKFRGANPFATWLSNNEFFEHNKNLISSDCGQHIGVLRFTCDALILDTQKDSSVQYIDQYLFSSGKLARAFLPAQQFETGLQFTTRQREFLRDILFSDDQKLNVNLLNNDLKALIKCGILTYDATDLSCSFVSPAAQRILFGSLFPYSSFDSPDPNNLFEWIIKVLEKFSITRIQSCISLSKKPLEDLYQKEFYRCIPLCLHPKYSISPELQIAYTGKKSFNRLDLYVNSFYKWGIELLREGDYKTAMEHHSRFALKGKYSPLGVRDYCVIDFSTTTKCCESFDYKLPDKFIAVVINADGDGKMTIHYGDKLSKPIQTTL